MHYARIKKQKTLLKIISGNEILTFNYNNENPKKSSLELKHPIDLCNFENEYNETQNKSSDLIFLNIDNSIIAIIKTNTFYYESATNKIQKYFNTKFEHNNGSLVYIPENKYIYCISGRNSIEVEKLKLNNKITMIHEWETVCSISEPRAFFSIFIQNSHKIYIMFGYNFKTENYIDFFECMDVKIEKEWLKIHIKADKIPKLSSCGILSFSSNNIYIFGGMDDKDEKNNKILRYSAEDNKLELAELGLKSNNDYLMLNPKLHPDTTPSLNFVEETNFQAFEFQFSYIENAFNFGCFDSKNFFHLINLKNFNHDLFYLDINNMTITDVNVTEDNYFKMDIVNGKQQHSGIDRKNSAKSLHKIKTSESGKSKVSDISNIEEQGSISNEKIDEIKEENSIKFKINR